MTTPLATDPVVVRIKSSGQTQLGKEYKRNAEMTGKSQISWLYAYFKIKKYQILVQYQTSSEQEVLLQVRAQ